MTFHVRYITIYSYQYISILKWFKDFENSARLKFFKFDIFNYYPTISPELLKNAIEYARSIDGVIITKSQENLIYQCRESYLFHNSNPWIEKEVRKEQFDVAMGLYDGAEVCELAGLYILHKLTRGIYIYKGAVLTSATVPWHGLIFLPRSLEIVMGRALKRRARAGLMTTGSGPGPGGPRP